jgi:hypothetical protein
MIRFVLFLLMLAPLAARSEDDAALTAGRTAAKTLMDTLGPQLKASMEAGGPVAAIGVCGAVAQQLTENLKVEHTAVVGVTRVTDRARNPKNLAHGLDQKVIMDYQASSSKDDRVVRSDNQLFYYKPLYLQELCLNCHGAKEQLKPEVRTLLDKNYPQDKAVDYAVGDFRGLIKVQLDPKKI